jgi:hypothetical protein
VGDVVVGVVVPVGVVVVLVPVGGPGQPPHGPVGTVTSGQTQGSSVVTVGVDAVVVGGVVDVSVVTVGGGQGRIPSGWWIVTVSVHG